MFKSCETLIELSNSIKFSLFFTNLQERIACRCAFNIGKFIYTRYMYTRVKNKL